MNAILRTTLDLSLFLTEAQRTLRQARDLGPTKKGRELLNEGAAMVDGHDFDALPEHAQQDLLALYSEAAFRVTGGFA